MDIFSKTTLRQFIKARKQRSSPEELKALSAGPLERLEKRQDFLSAQVVLVYYSLPDEVATIEFIERWYTKKKILLPVVVGNNIELVVYTGIGNLRLGAWGIHEPTGSYYTDYGTIDLAIVPGVAFDKSGHRLGRGRGYYDRLLPKLRREGCRLLGLCFDFQQIPAVPTDEHDVSVDELI